MPVLSLAWLDERGKIGVSLGGVVIGQAAEPGKRGPRTARTVSTT